MADIEKITSHVFIYPFEDERDRPNIGYIKGDKINLAIEAGHSENHVKEFYSALNKVNLPLPDLTAVTHWHWDHTFGMHAVHGLTIAEERTNKHLQYQQSLAKEDLSYQQKMMSMDACIQKEYEDQTMTVTPADIVFHDHLTLDLDGIHAEISHIPSPHTDDGTVILIKEEKVLFIGDAISGPYPDYDHPDPLKSAQLKQCIEQLDFSICVGGHWIPESKEELLNRL